MTESQRIVLVILVAMWAVILFAPRVPSWMLRKRYSRELMSRTHAGVMYTVVLIVALLIHRR